MISSQSSNSLWQNASVFVTGGTGFVGSHLVERLLSLGCTDVRCLVRKDPKWLKGLPVTFIEGDLTDEEALRRGLKGAHYVFHIAALTRSTRWEEFLLANVTGTEKLLSVARAESSLKNSVVVSSLAAIGASGEAVATEATGFSPVSMYGRSKAEMEQRILSLDQPLTIVRPPAVYGPRETDILTFFKSINSRLCPIVGSPNKPVLSLVYVDDLVEGLLQSALEPAAIGKTFFLGGPRQYSWGEIRDATTQALNKRALTIRIPPAIVPAVGAISESIGKVFGSYPPLNREKAEEITRATIMCDSSLATSTWGYSPITTLEMGIPKTMAWYKENGWMK